MYFTNCSICDLKFKLHLKIQIPFKYIYTHIHTHFTHAHIYIDLNECSLPSKSNEVCSKLCLIDFNEWNQD